MLGHDPHPEEFERASLPTPTTGSRLLQTLWRRLKQWRRVRLGPMALHYKFDRSVRVSRNTRRRGDVARLRHLVWLEDRDDAARGTPDTAAPRPSATRDPAEIALIVGVGPGFGYALARHLASQGMLVVMVARNAERLDALAGEIAAEGGVAVAYGCDATSESSVAELFRRVSRDHGVPHLVVYSLQSFGPGKVVDIELPAFEEGWKHNCLGPFLVAREAARTMLPARRGSIVLTGSTSSVLGRAGHLNLAVGKFGQRALAQVLSRELWSSGIHVAHLMIDADIRDGTTTDLSGTESDPGHIAQSVLNLHRQPATAWTSELDIRPWNEKFWEHC